MKKDITILAIETSCDETSAAIVLNGTDIITNIVASSKDLHEKTGGIIPEIAAREQVKCIIPVIEEACREHYHRNNKRVDNLSKIKKSVFSSIDAIAVTVGPGLIGSLLVGVETAKTLSYVSGKPIIP